MRQSPLRTLLIWGSALFVCILFVGYGLFEARRLIEGPRIVIDTPKDGETLSDPMVHISGNVQNAAFLSINDVPVLADAQGNFDTELTPPPGYEVFKISATDRFKRTKTILLHVLVLVPGA